MSVSRRRIPRHTCRFLHSQSTSVTPHVKGMWNATLPSMNATRQNAIMGWSLAGNTTGETTCPYTGGRGYTTRRRDITAANPPPVLQAKLDRQNPPLEATPANCLQLSQRIPLFEAELEPALESTGPIPASIPSPPITVTLRTEFM